MVTPTSSQGARASAAAPCSHISGDSEDRDDLLLIVLRIRAVVVGRDGRCVGHAVAGGDTEVVADERIAARRAGRVRRVELRVPAVLREADVVALWRQGGCVELDARVDAVVRRAI